MADGTLTFDTKMNLSGLQQGMSQIGTTVRSGMSSAVSAFKSGMDTIAGKVSSAMKSVGSSIDSVVTGALGKLDSTFGTNLTGVYNSVKSTFSTMASTVKSSMANMSGGIADNWGTIATVSAGGATAVVAAVAAIGVGAAMIAGAMANAAMEFEYGMAKVATITGQAGDELKAVGSEVLDVSTKYGMASGEMTDALYQTVSAGIDAAESTQFLDKAARLATAGFTTTAGAVDAMTSILNAYGKEASEADRVSDLLIQTQNLGKCFAPLRSNA